MATATSDCSSLGQKHFCINVGV